MKGLEQIKADEAALAASRRNRITEDDLLQSARSTIHGWDWSQLADDAQGTEFADALASMARLEGLFAQHAKARGGK